MKESCTWKTNLRRIDQKKSGDVVIFGDSITNVSRYKIFSIEKSKIVEQDSKNPRCIIKGHIARCNPN